MTYMQQALDLVLKLEGGYVDDPDDRGGATNFGISQRSHPELDIKSLTKDQAIEIYRKKYWDANKLDWVASCNMCVPLFCFVVHAGPARAIIALQSAINKMLSVVQIVTDVDHTHTPYQKDKYKKLKEDGVLGKKTATYVIRYDILLNSFFYAEMIKHYASLCQKNRTQLKFLIGWINRANQCTIKIAQP